METHVDGENGMVGISKQAHDYDDGLYDAERCNSSTLGKIHRSGPTCK